MSSCNSRGHGSVDLFAVYDSYPDVAVAIVEGCRLHPASVPVEIIFNSSTGTAQGDTAVGAFPSILAQPLLIQSVDYVVERPNAYNGSIFKCQSDYYTAQVPYVDLTVNVDFGRSMPRYTISADFIPLSIFGSKFRARWPSGWFLDGYQGLKVSAKLTRQLEPDENPYRIVLTFNGWTLFCADQVFADCSSCSRGELRERFLAGVKKYQTDAGIVEG